MAIVVLVGLGVTLGALVIQAVAGGLGAEAASELLDRGSRTTVPAVPPVWPSFAHISWNSRSGPGCGGMKAKIERPPGFPAEPAA